MALTTTGTKANSWVSLDDANLILLEVYSPDIPAGFQLNTEHIPQLIEAAKAISNLWSFPGTRVEALQTLAWPRKDVSIPSERPRSNWFSTNYPHLDPADEAYVYFLAYEAPGFLSSTIYPADQIPDEVKEAQAILAALFVQGVTVWEDNKGDNTQVQIDTLKIDNVNAVSRIMIVKERLARWGKFIGSHMSAPGGARG